MARNKAWTALLALATLVALSAPSWGGMLPPPKGELFTADLSGYEEVTPKSTTGTGSFTLTVLKTGVIEYELSYSGLESEARQAHIHFGQPGVNGAIIVFLCTNLGNGPNGDEPACPQSGTVTGSFDAADIIGPNDQGIAPGELDEALAAIRSGVTYANIHTTAYPAGEIRGQIMEKSMGNIPWLRK